MRLTTVIHRLAALLENHGDLSVMIDDADTRSRNSEPGWLLVVKEVRAYSTDEDEIVVLLRGDYHQKGNVQGGKRT